MSVCACSAQITPSRIAFTSSDLTPGCRPCEPRICTVTANGVLPSQSSPTCTNGLRASANQTWAGFYSPEKAGKLVQSKDAKLRSGCHHSNVFACGTSAYR